jgi:hypothetical protein
MASAHLAADNHKRVDRNQNRQQQSVTGRCNGSQQNYCNAQASDELADLFWFGHLLE